MVINTTIGAGASADISLSSVDNSNFICVGDEQRSSTMTGQTIKVNNRGIDRFITYSFQCRFLLRLGAHIF
jgi:hypothetical protein